MTETRINLHANFSWGTLALAREIGLLEDIREEIVIWLGRLARQVQAEILGCIRRELLEKSKLDRALKAAALKSFTLCFWHGMTSYLSGTDGIVPASGKTFVTFESSPGRRVSLYVKIYSDRIFDMCEVEQVLSRFLPVHPRHKPRDYVVYPASLVDW